MDVTEEYMGCAGGMRLRLERKRVVRMETSGGDKAAPSEVDWEVRPRVAAEMRTVQTANGVEAAAGEETAVARTAEGMCGAGVNARGNRRCNRDGDAWRARLRGNFLTKQK